MHIHIRTSVPGIQKLLSFVVFVFVFFFFFFFVVVVVVVVVFVSFSLSPLAPFLWRTTSRAGCPRTEHRGEERKRRNKENALREDAGWIREHGGIENRRAIRETQRRDSITLHKESKPYGEINKQPRLLVLRRRRGSWVNERRDLCTRRKKNS